jgi:ankyrin repeat protein
MKTRLRLGLLCFLCLPCFAPAFGADPLLESLQEGLLQEEVHRNLPAALQAYESAVAHADAQRQAAATALFRLAETFRKLGRTNEATLRYQRLLQDFADQTNIAVLARQNLNQHGAGRSPATPPLTPAAQRQRELLQQELALVEAALQSGVVAQSPEGVLGLQRDRLALQRQILELESRVRTDLLDVVLPPRSEPEPAGVASLREEIKLLETQLAETEARSADRRSTTEVDEVRRELLRLERQLPENADVARQRALLEQELALVHRQVSHLALLAEAGRIPKADQVQAQRALLALQRELASLNQPSTDARQPGGASLDATTLNAADEARRLAAQLARLEQLNDDPETQARALQSFFPDERLERMLWHLEKLRAFAAFARTNQDVLKLDGLLPISPDGTGGGKVQVELNPGQPSPYLDDTLAEQLGFITQLAQHILKTQQARLFVLQGAAEPAASVQAMATTTSLPPAVDPADAASLREELALVEQELLVARKKLENGKAEEVEVRRVERELLRLQRKLPENAARDRQIALLEEELKLTERGLTEVRRKIEVGAAAPLDEIPLRRELLATQRELAAVKRQPATPPVGAGPATTWPATPEEAAELQRIRAIMRDSPDLVNARNTPDTNRGTPLHKAAALGYFAVAEFLLANGADVNAPDGQRRTPLHLAAEAGHRRLCELLLARGADVRVADETRYTPLHLAVIQGYTSLVETLLAAGAEVNTQGYVPPLNRQPHPTSSDWPKMETTPLHSAAEKGFPALVELLDQHGADLHARDRGGRTPLIRAVLADQPTCVNTLAKCSADLNLTDGAGCTALGHALRQQNLGLAQLLLDLGADPETRIRGDGDSQEGEWTVLFEPVGRGRVEPTRLLLGRGANVNARAATGISPVHFAALANAPDTLALLLEGRAEVNVRDAGGNTPLHYALEGASLPIVEKLLEAGADPQAPGWNGGQESNWPPLLSAIRTDPRRSPAALLDTLLRHGADANARLTNGWTALHRAVQFNRPDLAALLVTNQADVNARGSRPQGEPVLGNRKVGAGSSAAVPSPTGLPGGGAPGSPVVTPQGVPLRMPAAGGLVSLSFGNEPLPADREVAPLHVAVANRNLVLADYLLAHGADVNLRDAESRTPLHFAIKYRDLDLIRRLLAAGADPLAKDSADWTPWQWANDLSSTRTMLRTPDGRSSWEAPADDIRSLLRDAGAAPPPAPAPSPSNTPNTPNTP